MLTNWTDAFSVYGFLMFLHVVVAVVCFFLSRAQEKRTGHTELAGKSTVLFTLANMGFVVLYLGSTMILTAIVQAGEGSGGWRPLRLGLALVLPALVTLVISGGLWKNWSGGSELLPRGNMALKCYTGLNTLAAGVLLAVLGTQILFFIMELIAGAVSWNSGADNFKAMAVGLLTTLGFLALNILLFGRSEDSVVPGTLSPLYAQITVEGGEPSTSTAPVAAPLMQPEPQASEESPPPPPPPPQEYETSQPLPVNEPHSPSPPPPPPPSTDDTPPPPPPP